MKLRSFFGLAAIGAACLSFAMSCSDDDGDDGGGGATGGTSSAGSGGSGMAGTGTQTGGLSFGDDIWPILKANCSGCHGDASFLGFATPNEAESYAVTLEQAYTGVPRYEEIVNKLETGEMPADTCGGSSASPKPPGTTGCISVADFDKIKAWAESGTPPAQ